MRDYKVRCVTIRKHISLMLIAVMMLSFLSGTVVFGEEDYAMITFGSSTNAVNISVSGGLMSIERGGRIGATTAKASWVEYAYFNIDDTFLCDIPMYTPIDITVEYFDQVEGGFALSYDSHNPDAGFGVANNVYAATEYVLYTGTNQWQTHTFHIENGKFANRADGWTDFRIGIWDPYMGVSTTDTILRSVKVEKSKYITPVEFKITSDFVGNIFSDDENIILKQNMLNKADEKIKAEYEYKVTNEEGHLIFEKKDVFEFEPKEIKERLLEIPHPKKYGIYSLEITERCVYSEETIKKYESGFSVVKKLSADERNPRSGIVSQVARGIGEPYEVTELLTYSGMNIIRDEIRWDAVEVDKGIYKIPQRAIDEIDGFVESGADVLLMLGFWHWAYDNNTTPYTEEGIQAFANYAAHLAKEFKGKVKYFEVWNEYDGMPLFNNGYQPPETYAKMLKATYKAIKAVNPEAIVVGIDVSGINLEFTEIVFENGGYDYCDAVSFHPYDYNAKYREVILYENVQKLKELMRKYGDPKPIYFTELGWATHRKGSKQEPWAANCYAYSHEEQARTQVLVNAFCEAYDLCEFITQYCLYDQDNEELIESCWGLVNSWNDKDDLEHGAKPAYLSLAAFNDFTGKYGEFRNVIADERFYSFIYYNSKYKKDIMLLQAGTGAGEKVEKYDLGCTFVDIYDLYGNHTATINSDNGVYALPVTEEPYYVMGNFNRVSLTDKEAIVTANRTDVECAIGDTVEFSFIKKGGRKLFLSIKPDENINVLENYGFIGDTAKLVLKVDSKGISNGKVVIEVKDEAGKVYYSFEHTMHLISPISVKISAKEAFENSGTHWNMKVVLENLSNSAVLSGKIHISMPDYLANVTKDREFTNLKAGEKQTFIINLPEIVNRPVMDAEVITTLENGYIQRDTEKLDFTRAVYAKKKPVIDGNVMPGEWTGNWVGAYSFDDIMMISDWKGPEDLSFSGTMMWDGDNFYFTAIVTDDAMSVNYTPQEINNMWMGDGIQMGFDDRDHSISVDSGHFTEIGLAYVPGYGDAVYRFSSLYDEIPSGVAIDKAQLCVKRYEKYTVYECAIPWSEIFYEGYKAEPQKVYRFALLANDNDSLGRRGWIEYTSGIGSAKDSSQFGTLKLIK